MAGIRALVLVPTAELCRQIKDVFVALSKYCQSEISVGFLTRDTPENVRRYVQALSQVRERERERERERDRDRRRERKYLRKILIGLSAASDWQNCLMYWLLLRICFSIT
jgi:hypothetical protein